MALVTESLVRQQLGGKPATRYELPAGTLVTPSARAWLIDHHIDLIIGGVCVTPGGVDPAAKPKTADAEVSALPAFVPPLAYDVVDGSQSPTKPEHLTALRGNLLVPKNHPQIKFRGMLDALEADIVAAEIAFIRLNLPRGLDDLREALRYVKEVLRCEVLDVPLEEAHLLGLDDAQLREHSHHPKQYYGITHFAASPEDGEAIAILNQLRTKARQTEIAAYDAFDAGGTKAPTRLDIVRGMNRLSSAFYLMMFKAKTGVYA